MILMLFILSYTHLFAKSSERPADTSQKLFYLFSPLHVQVLLPPYDDSVSVPPKQAPPLPFTATAWKQSQDPAVNKAPEKCMHCTTFPVYSQIMDIVDPHTLQYTHAHTATSLTHTFALVHTTTTTMTSPSLPVIYWWIHIFSVTSMNRFRLLV